MRAFSITTTAPASRSCATAAIAYMHYIVPVGLKANRQVWRQGVVDEEFQSDAANGSCRSSTAAAAKRSTSCRSSSSRSGYSARTSSLSMPCASRPTTVATGIRSSRTQGTPPIWSGRTVIRLKRIANPKGTDAGDSKASGVLGQQLDCRAIWWRSSPHTAEASAGPCCQKSRGGRKKIARTALAPATPLHIPRRLKHRRTPPVMPPSVHVRRSACSPCIVVARKAKARFKTDAGVVDGR